MPYPPNENAAIPILQDKRQGGYGGGGYHRSMYPARSCITVCHHVLTQHSEDQGKPEREKLGGKESPTSGVDVLTLAIGKLKVEDRW